jgi:hypothetical protein
VTVRCRRNRQWTSEELARRRSEDSEPGCVAELPSRNQSQGSVDPGAPVVRRQQAQRIRGRDQPLEVCRVVQLIRPRDAKALLAR